MIISVLLLLSLRKLQVIQVLIADAVGEGGEDGRGDGFGGDVQLRVISITGELETMAADRVKACR